MENPLLLNVVGGLITEVLVALAVQLSDRVGRSRKPTAIRRTLRQESDLPAILDRAATKVARTLDLSDQRTADAVRVFLSSPEALSAVRGLYSSDLLNASELQSAVREEFLANLRAHTRGALNSTRAGQIFTHLLEASHAALEQAIESGVLSAHEAMSSRRFQVLRHDIAAIQRSIELVTNPSTDVPRILDFENKLRNQIRARFSTIVPPHLDSASKVPIESLFVAPRLQALDGPSKQIDDVSLDHFLATVSRAVVLGNPGGGKSTLAQKLCHDLASPNGATLNGRSATPFLLLLRDFGAEQKNAHFSLAEFIEAIARSQLQLKEPRGAIEYLLTSGRLVLFLDGLDELLETRQRREMTAIVESFTSLYPEVRLITTSREVGYEQAPLDSQAFQLFRLAGFDETQVKHYAKKWFALDGALSETQQSRKAVAFIRESETVSDLTQNPLMLALMCNIYRGENYIPQNRPDVYEKCALMLFERWDKSRGIQVQLPFEAHLRPALTHIAHWIYSNKALQAGVEEAALIERTTSYLHPRRFEDLDEARDAARQFVDFCRGRAWVFTDTGTTANGERLFQFTHRTFMEYFTAGHLTRTCESADLLYDSISRRIEAREWDVVAQLAFQIKNRSLEDAGDRLLLRTIAGIRRMSPNVLNRISFAARALEFMVPSRPVVRSVTATTINAILDHVIDAERGDAPARVRALSRGPRMEMLAAVFYSARENRTVALDEIERVIGAKIQTDEPVAWVAAELAATVNLPLYRPSGSTERSGEVARAIGEFQTRLLERHRERLREFARSRLSIALPLYWRGLISIAELVCWHGNDALFKGETLGVLPGSIPSPVEKLLFELGNSRQLDGRVVDLAAEVGSELAATSPPWTTTSLPRWSRPAQSYDSLAGDALFAVAALRAAWLEKQISLPSILEKQTLLSSILKKQISSPSTLEQQMSTPATLEEKLDSFLAGRFSSERLRESEDAIQRLEVNDLQREFLQRWVARDFDLLTN